MSAAREAAERVQRVVAERDAWDLPTAVARVYGAADGDTLDKGYAEYSFAVDLRALLSAVAAQDGARDGRQCRICGYAEPAAVNGGTATVPLDVLRPVDQVLATASILSVSLDDGAAASRARSALRAAVPQLAEEAGR